MPQNTGYTVGEAYKQDLAATKDACTECTTVLLRNTRQ